jgi:serine protease Do
MAPGGPVRLGILREGREYTLAVALGRSPQPKSTAAADPGQGSDESSDPEKLGLALAPGKQTERGTEGVVVVEVDPQGIAAERGFQPGDVILDVAGSAVSAPTEVNDALIEARKQRRNNVIARVRTGDSTRFVAIPTG